MPRPGVVGIHEVVVEHRHTAHALGNHGVLVLATPMVAHFCSLAAQRALAPDLGEREVALPVRSTLAHLKASPPGARIVAIARVTEVDGRRVDFAVEASDGEATVMTGTLSWTVEDRAVHLAAERR